MLSTEELDRLIDDVTKPKASTLIVRPYDPEGAWLWTQWSGSLLQLTRWKVLGLAALAGANCAVVNNALQADWPLFAMPGPSLDAMIASEPLVARLESLSTVWEYELTLCTFVVTFFLNQAWQFRSSLYETLRTIQGCCQDICLLASLHVQREPQEEEGAGTTAEGALTLRGSGYTAAAEALLEDIGRYTRVAHVLFWSARGAAAPDYIVSQSSQDRRVDQVARFGPLVSTEGLRRLMERGELSAHELATLRATGLAESEYCYVLLEWIGLRLIEADEAGLMRGNSGQYMMLSKLTTLRGSYFAIGDALDFRMSLAYVQFVQTLVDILVFVAPFALYPKVGAWSIPLAALITYFYCGLLELSKSFFDAFGREGYLEQTINVEVLICEVNNAASRRWVQVNRTCSTR